MKPVGCFLIAGLLVGFTSCSQQNGAAPPTASPVSGDRSVLLVTLDTTRADALGCYGSAGADTPALDALAADGVRWANASCQVPLTLPSHCCILTGWLPYRTGVHINGVHRLSDSVTTLAERLREQGYQTGAILGSVVLSRMYGLDQGFELYDDRISGSERDARAVTDLALAYLADHTGPGSDPFFLWVHYFDPHAPYDPPSPYREQYADAPYAGEIAYTDEEFGRLVEGMKELGLWEGTLVAVVGDHGEALGEHGEATHGHFLYQSTLWVPLLLACRGVLPPGRVISAPVTTMDVAPTILSLLGQEYEGLDGVSLWPEPQGGEAGGPAYAETLGPNLLLGWSPLYALRRDNWKYILAPREELYDLGTDPGELNNLAAELPDVREELSARLREFLEEAASKHAAAIPVEMEPETAEKLAALGYLGWSGFVVPRGDSVPELPDPKDMVPVLEQLYLVEEIVGQQRKGNLEVELTRLIGLAPRSILALKMRADYLSKHARLDEAARDWDRILELAPDHPGALFQRGRLFERAGDLVEAASYYARSLAVLPGDENVYNNLGNVYDALGRHDRAAEVFEQGRMRCPESVLLLNNYGAHFANQGDFERAAQLWQKVLEIDPGNERARTFLRRLENAAGNRGPSSSGK